MLLLEAAAFAVLLQYTYAIQPSAQNPARNQEFRDLEWGDLNFLHGWHAGHLSEPQYSADLGDYISFISHMRQRAKEKGVDLLVIDSGDRVEGNGLYDASEPKGLYTRRILQQLDVDILTTGNHELYNGATALNEKLHMVSYFGDREWEPMANRSLKFTTESLRLNVMAFGFLFNFTGNYKNTRVKPVATVLKEKWFQEAIADTDVDLFLVAAHIDVHTLELQQIHDAIRAVQPETPIQFFGGHSHIRDFKVFDAKSTALESGRYFETAGFLSLDGLVPKSRDDLKPKDGGSLRTFRRYLDFNRFGFQYHSVTDECTFDTLEGIQVTSDIALYRHILKLNRLIGCAPRDFTLYRDPYPSPGNWYSYLGEHILPEMVYNKQRSSVPRMIFINGGSQRFDVFKRFTYDTSFLVSPFTSRFKYAADVKWEVASQLLDYFNNDPSPYSAQAQENGDLPPLDAHADYIEPPSPHHPAFGKQAPLVRGREKYRKIIGYTTKDDFGHTGDDTVHQHFDKFSPPKVLQANGSFPVDYATTPPEVVDVVFFDFIAKNVATGLNHIVGKEEYKASEFGMYMGREDTLTKLILEFVDRRWGKDC
ncbi:Metallo-dependent phosphatase-like protein [Trichophaea hybrida]|nr:Metallo-dependent phosphatase-like protein [Trichophaea hybrida]